MIRKLFLGLVFIAIIVMGFGAFKWNSFYQPISDNSEEVVFEVRPASFTRIALELKDLNLIKDVFLFKLLAKLENKESKVRVGEYLLDRSMNPGEILDELVSGKMIHHSFTVQEGLNMYEIADILSQNKLADKEEFLKLCKDKSFIKSLLGVELNSLEGYLFPDTYSVTKYDGAKKIIETMVGKFEAVYNEILSQQNKLEIPKHKSVILASIIEKETGAPHERPMISSVFHNRLKKRMRLQSDPTIIYGIKETTGVWINNIRKKHIKSPTPFNTYTVRALPKGPISNPGKESLSAALNPVESKNLYFVSKNDGTHRFSKSLREHNAAVRKFQLDRNARKGKSWRDLNKKK